MAAQFQDRDLFPRASEDCDANGRAIATTDPFLVANPNAPYIINSDGLAMANPAFSAVADTLVTPRPV